jgi:2-polyprenyl-3-methyl-5-hydroxy-6-metoxy-1,4-benzoquinol methylase
MTEKINCLYCNSSQATPFRSRADIVKCDSCGLVYLRTRPTKETMYEIYQAYANDTSHMKPPSSMEEVLKHGLRREYFVNEIIELLPAKEGNWLDIGCGWGALLFYAQEKGFIPKGIEMTRNCLDFATLFLNIPVSNSQFTDSVIPKSSCNSISMVHVLEHIPNPKETLQKVFETLCPGGYYSGIVPNIESFCSENLKDDWVWLDSTHHYVHYSPSTLKQKLEEAGFIIKRIYTAVGDYDYTAVVNSVKKEYGIDRMEDVIKKVQELEKLGKGEEIRFFVYKP